MTVNIKELREIKKNILSYRNVKLCVVTKNRSAEDINELIKQDVHIFAENRLQEAEKKYGQILINNKHLELHLIGPLQSKKVKSALRLFDVIQSIDRYKIIDLISEFIKKYEYKTKKFFLQVNIGNEPQKSGIDQTSVNEFYEYAIKKKLNIVGLMCIPPNNSDSSLYFNAMYELRENLDKNLLLSMGMSSDYQFALKSGSNLVRIGSRIFE